MHIRATGGSLNLNPECLVQPRERDERIAAGKNEAVDAGRSKWRFEILGTARQINALGTG